MRQEQVVGAAMLAAMWMATSAAAMPEQINYQGRLVDGTNLVNGQIGLILSLYDAETDGTLFYADSNLVTVVDGLYATYLGDGTIAGTLTGALASAEAWLETTVDGTVLSPRERLVAVPYALTAAAVEAGAVTAEGVDAASFATTFWRAGGNAGTTAGTHFLGTTDDEPLELRVNGARALRVEPTTGTPNLIGGHTTNTASAGVTGATISGGGGSGGAWNRVTDDFGTIGGGRNNRTGDDAGTSSDAWFATVGGGRANVASGPESVIAGGKSNQTTGEFAAVGGGATNLAGGQASVVAGGLNNQTFGTASSVLGGSGNVATANYSAACGGIDNTAAGARSFIGGGNENLTLANYSFIGGGRGNQTLTNGYLPSYSVICGGYENQADSENSFVGSGYHNHSLGFRSSVVGGEQNETHGWHGFVGGGDENVVYTNYSAIVGGYQNISSNNYTFIGGGNYNYALGIYSAILGGRGNTAEGNYSVAGGFQSAATHVGEFAHASGYFAERGDAQASEYVLRRTSTVVPLVQLYLNGDSGTSPITLASNRVVAFEALITAAADNGDAAVYKYSGGIKRIGTNSVQLIGSVSEDLVLEDDASWSVVVDAHTAGNSLRFRVTGNDSRTIRWVATVRTTETVFP